MSTLRVGVLGCGMILGKYLKTIARLPHVEVVAVSDLLPERAEKVAADLPGARAVTPEGLLADPDVDLVLNLTIPAVHYETTLAALAAGKHVYVEKPLATTLEEGKELVAAAQAAGLRLGVAPDTVLGTGIQTARSVVDEGGIGRVLAASAFFAGGGPDNFHATPAFFYQPGGGPLLDMGPYYVTSLVTLLGPVRRVSALASSLRPTRTSTGGPNEGGSFDVAVPTHVSATLEHEGGVLSTLVASFDVAGGSRLPRIEVYGVDGTINVPDPNTFGGEVVRHLATGGDWQPVAVSAGAEDSERGTGIADMAGALAEGRPHRASSELALHVLDVLTTIEAAAAAGQALETTTTCQRPEPMPLVPQEQVGA